MPAIKGTPYLRILKSSEECPENHFCVYWRIIELVDISFKEITMLKGGHVGSTDNTKMIGVIKDKEIRTQTHAKRSLSEKMKKLESSSRGKSSKGTSPVQSWLHMSSCLWNFMDKWLLSKLPRPWHLFLEGPATQYSSSLTITGRIQKKKTCLGLQDRHCCAQSQDPQRPPRDQACWGQSSYTNTRWQWPWEGDGAFF